MSVLVSHEAHWLTKHLHACLTPFLQAALKCKGPSCATNFPCERYADLLGSLSSMTLEELIMAVRRQSQVRG
jgi:hypothetical protein